MPRLCRNALSAAMVRTAGPGSYVDANGLMLRVKARGTRQRVQRITLAVLISVAFLSDSQQKWATMRMLNRRKADQSW